MTWQVLIMFAVSGVFTLLGLAMLVSLAWPTAPARVYVFRMVGIMLVAAGFVLGLSAEAMFSWGPGR